MYRLSHPVRSYQEWKADQRDKKCVVEIEHPRMKIKGRRYRQTETDQRYTIYFGFIGIPYAAAPKEHLRFLPPQPLRVRRHRFQPKVLRAKPTSNHPCVQFTRKPVGRWRTVELFGSEDCLYLNVYTPEKPEDIAELLPVLVYIHGGEFERGTNDRKEIQPQYIVESNLILVTINYRLGVFGFLNTRTVECQGNAGLKDQVKALEWIRDNIAKFKGNPGNVTISGHEAGATCVNLHLISPLSRNLFHKAIVQAGGIHCPWGFKAKNQFVNELSKKAFRSKTEDMKEAMVNTMQRIRVTDLMIEIEKLSRRYLERRSRKLTVFLGPSEEFRAEGAFLPPCESIETLMEQATPVPIIAGITEREGYKYFDERLDWTEKKFKDMITNEDEFIKFLTENFQWSPESARSKMSVIKKLYFEELTSGSEPIDFKTVEKNLAVFFTDLWFHRFYDNFKIGNEPFVTEPLYVYQFDYLDTLREDGHPIVRGENEEVRMIARTAPGHGDDIRALYNPHKIRSLERSDRRKILNEKLTTKVMCKLWANFCYNKELKYRGFVWSRHTEEEPQYLSINNSLAMVPGRLGGDRWPILRSILESVSKHQTPEPEQRSKWKPGTSIEGEFSTTSDSETYQSSTDVSTI